MLCDGCCKHASIVDSALTKWIGCVYECVLKNGVQHKLIFTTFNWMFSSQIDL